MFTSTAVPLGLSYGDMQSEEQSTMLLRSVRVLYIIT